jgi:hypothetical protein
MNPKLTRSQEDVLAAGPPAWHAGADEPAKTHTHTGELTMKTGNPHHFFVTSAYDWRTGTNLFDALDRLPVWAEDQIISIWKVPGPEDQAYSIQHFSPMVDGAVEVYQGPHAKHMK